MQEETIFIAFDNLHEGREKVKPTFFKSEKEVDDMVHTVFGISEASESGGTTHKIKYLENVLGLNFDSLIYRESLKSHSQVW